MPSSITTAMARWDSSSSGPSLFSLLSMNIMVMAMAALYTRKRIVRYQLV